MHRFHQHPVLVLHYLRLFFLISSGNFLIFFFLFFSFLLCSASISGFWLHLLYIQPLGWCRTVGLLTVKLNNSSSSSLNLSLYISSSNLSIMLVALKETCTNISMSFIYWKTKLDMIWGFTASKYLWGKYLRRIITFFPLLRSVLRANYYLFLPSYLVFSGLFINIT